MATKMTLATVFTAIDNFTKPVDRMGSTAKRFGTSVKSIEDTLARPGKILGGIIKPIAAFAAVASVAGVAAGKVITAFADKGDEVAKTARMLGLTTDALQELRHAASMQGVTSEQLTQGFKLLNNQLGQLQTGTGSLYSTLAKTNPALAKQLKTVTDTDEAFMVLMDAIASETNVAKRAALAQAAFGKSGQELIKVAVAGRAGIADLRDEAHKYGLVISQDAAEASEGFADSLERLKGTASSLFNQVLGQAVVKLQPIIQAMADWVATNKELIGQKIDSTINAIGGAAKFLSDAWNSGAIPAILAGVAVFKALQLGLAAFNAVLAITTMLSVANPFGAIVLAISAIVAGIVFILKSWNKLGDISGSTAAASGTAQTDEWGVPIRGSSVPISPQTTAMESSSYAESRSTVDINVGGLPSGSTVAQSGRAPGVTLNTGRTIGGAR